MDLLFIINFVMDFIIFAITTMLLNKPFYIKRLIVSGLLGALLYCMLFVYPVVQILKSQLWALLVPALPILYLFRPKNFKGFIKCYMISTGVAALIGGLSFTVWYRLQYYFSNFKPTILYIVSIGIGVGFVVYSTFYTIRKHLFMPYLEYELEIQYKGRVKKILALLDTGNRLYTPISHKPVIVVTFEEIKELLTIREIQDIEMCHNNPQKLLEIEKGPRYIIPFHSMGCKESLLWGILSEHVVLRKAQFKRQLKECVIGIAFDNLCSDRDYKALLHPDFIINEEE